MSGRLAAYWMDEELSDMDVVLALPSDTTATSDTNSTSTPTRQLSKLPGHKLVLCMSPYLKAQVSRWFDEHQLCLICLWLTLFLIG